MKILFKILLDKKSVSILLFTAVFTVLIDYGMSYFNNFNQFSLSAISKSVMELDYKFGMRWNSSINARIVRYANGELQYDNIFSTNNKGFASDLDFKFKKKDGTLRFLVFGASYSFGSFLKTNWPNRLQQKLDEEGIDIEFYNFSLDGSGNLNTYRLFFEMIVPNYEFDGVIIASFLLTNYFAAGKSDDKNYYFYRFTDFPDSSEEFKQEFERKSFTTYKVLSSKQLDNLHNNFEMMPYYTINILKEIKSLLTINKKKKLDSKSNNHSIYQRMTERYGSQSVDRFEQIIKYCINNNKLFILSNIPKKDWSLSGQDDQFHREQFLYFKDKYKITFFDFAKQFSTLSKDEFSRYWLKFDGHWSQAGSDFYASEFFKQFKVMLKQKKINKFTHSSVE